MIVQSGRKDGAPSPSSVIGLAIESISHVRAAEGEETQNQRDRRDDGKNDQGAFQTEPRTGETSFLFRYRNRQPQSLSPQPHLCESIRPYFPVTHEQSQA
jgi:hypothetical protein